MCFSPRLSEMNVLYISSDCRGVTQSSWLHTRTGPVDGATALQETPAEALRKASGYPSPHWWERTWSEVLHCVRYTKRRQFLPPKKRREERG